MDLDNGGDGDGGSGDEARERGPEFNFGHRRTKGLDNHALPSMRLCLLAAVSRSAVLTAAGPVEEPAPAQEDREEVADSE